MRFHLINQTVLYEIYRGSVRSWVSGFPSPSSISEFFTERGLGFPFSSQMNRKFMPEVNRDEVAGKNQPEDVQWLSLLSNSELDLLIYLKQLVIQRAKVVGHESLADKFDLKLLRAVGFILMEYLKERLEGSSVLSGVEASSLLNACSSIDLNLKDHLSPSIIEDLNTSVITNSRKRKESIETPTPTARPFTR